MGEGQATHQVAPLAERWVRLTKETRLHQAPYPIVGLTGGIASGKSSVAQLFKERGVPVLSADELVKDIYRWPLTKITVAALAPQALKDGEVDFPTLRQLVFSDEKLKQEIEAFIYARLPQAFRDRAAQFENIPWLVYEVPLLFERHLEKLVDVSLVVWCSRGTQLKRLKARDPLTTDEVAEAILNAQLALDEKRRGADLVIDNDGGPRNELATAVQDVYQKLTAPN